jgi:tRNA A37 methylthiotransferase MiaB
MAKTYFIRTFGCQTNEQGSEGMAGLLEVQGNPAGGLRTVDRPTP